MTSKRRVDVVVVGSANLDHIAQVQYLPAVGETVAAGRYLTAPGGKGLNQAVAAARQGVSVAFVGCVGDDAAGESVRLVLGREAIDTSATQTLTEQSTGLALITVSEDGDNTVVVGALANGRVTTETVDAAGALIDEGRVLITQLEIPMDAVGRALSRARSAGAITVLNPAPASGALDNDVLAVVDVLVPNAFEATALTGLEEANEAARALVQAGCPTVIVTMGDAGALVATAKGLDWIPPVAVHAVDGTAAGDAFCGVLAAGLARGEPVSSAVRRAAAAGALATTVVGAVPSLPSASAVDALLDQTVTPT